MRFLRPRIGIVCIFIAVCGYLFAYPVMRLATLVRSLPPPDSDQ